jgi:hypothetical protein
MFLDAGITVRVERCDGKFLIAAIRFQNLLSYLEKQGVAIVVRVVS